MSITSSSKDEVVDDDDDVPRTTMELQHPLPHHRPPRQLRIRLQCPLTIHQPPDVDRKKRQCHSHHRTSQSQPLTLLTSLSMIMPVSLVDDDDSGGRKRGRKRHRTMTTSHHGPNHQDRDSDRSCCDCHARQYHHHHHHRHYWNSATSTIMIMLLLVLPGASLHRYHSIMMHSDSWFLLLTSSLVTFSMVPVSAWVSLPTPPQQRIWLQHRTIAVPKEDIRHTTESTWFSKWKIHGRCGNGPFTHPFSSTLFVSSNSNDDGEDQETTPQIVHPSKQSPSFGTSASSSKTGMNSSSSSQPQKPEPAGVGKDKSSSKSNMMMNQNHPNRNAKKNHSRTNQRSDTSTNNTTAKNYNSNSSKSGKWNATTTMTSKQELVKAVGASIQATRQKQQQKRQQQAPPPPMKQMAMDTLSDGALSTRTNDKVTKTKTSSLLNQLLNPYEAGQKLRQSIETTITSIQTQTDPNKALLQQSQYYIDDRFIERGTVPISSSSTSLYSTGGSKKRATLLPWEEPETAFIPEILVVGATGRLGRLIVRQLLQQSSSGTKSKMGIGSSPPPQLQVPKVRVRVLVRDLYTRTLDILGTGVTYCQGDLLKIDTLEDAVTDIDKLVFVASASSTASTSTAGTVDEQEQYERRIQMAEQIDYMGMSNLISAYQNVRHADYGTSQAAKRSLFKFQDRNREDFFLFSIDEDDDDDADTGSTDTGSENMSPTDDNGKSTTKSMTTASAEGASTNVPFVSTTSYDAEYDKYDDTYGNMMNTEDYTDTYGSDDDIYHDDYDEYSENDDEANYEAYATSLNNIEKRNDSSVVKTQSQWIRNTFNHGVFVGRIPQTSPSANSRNIIGGESAIISSRLRARDDPEMGIELGPNFAGFICRVCSDGNMYEAFVRTGSYATNGIEYVCGFTTSTKNPTASTKGTSNASRNKFLSVRLPFSSFKPVQRKTISRNDSDDDSFIVPPFRGYDVRHIGFRYRSSSNTSTKNGSQRIDRKTGIEWNRFYLAISYIKVYRSQPEPEFVYVSDARIPHIVHDHMIEHETKQILPYSEVSIQTLSNRKSGAELNLLQSGTEIQLESQRSQRSNQIPTTYDHTFVHSKRIPEETYYKYRGEELLKKSGLSYAIVRVGELCDSPASLDGMKNIVLSPSTSSSSTPATEDDVANGKQSNTKLNELVAISRSDVAQICVQALLDPNALNKSFYVHHTAASSSTTEDLSTKFASLPTDSVK